MQLLLGLISFLFVPNAEGQLPSREPDPIYIYSRGESIADVYGFYFDKGVWQLDDSLVQAVKDLNEPAPATVRLATSMDRAIMFPDPQNRDLDFVWLDCNRLSEIRVSPSLIADLMNELDGCSGRKMIYVLFDSPSRKGFFPARNTARSQGNPRRPAGDLAPRERKTLFDELGRLGYGRPRR